MADPRFFKNFGPHSLQDLADLVGGCLSESNKGEQLFKDVAPLDKAGPEDISFLDNERYLPSLKESKAGACIVNAQTAAAAPEGMALLVASDPHKAYAEIASRFYPDQAFLSQSSECMIDNRAVIARNATLGRGCRIGPNAVVSDHVILGDGVVVGASSVIGRGVTIGAGTVIGSNVSIEYSDVGKACQIHAGARLGTRGFGFAMPPTGFVDVPQVGRVIVGDAVEIGANTTIDRGSGPDTEIGDGTKIDNLVQIAHNCKIGRNCVLVSQVGIAGSSVLEDFVVLGGQVGVAGHVAIGRGAQVAAKSGVTKSVAAGQKVAGSPAIPLNQWARQLAVLKRLCKKAKQ